MATATGLQPDVQLAVPNDGPSSSRPERVMEQLEVDENAPPVEEVVYSTGAKVWLALGALYTAGFLQGLDLTIVAVAVPSLTDHFKTVNDIGWYSAAYGLVASAFMPFVGKVCTVISPKNVVIVGLITFWLGSLVCTFAHTSMLFIIGRGICGLGISGMGIGSLTLVTHLFPSHKRSIWLSLGAATTSVGLSCAPVIGGLLIDAFSWRACFGINLPLCPLVIAFTAYFLEDPIKNPNSNLTLAEKFKRLDPFGTLLVVPAITCLLMGLQWGGIKYGWRDPRIIVLFITFAVLATGFGYQQYRLGDKATVPPRILKKRSILAAMWFSACCNGILAITEYYISIYWQGVRNESATKSGLLGLSMIVGLLTGGVTGGFGTNIIGYFTPFMLGTSIMAPIASGLLTTLDLHENKAKVVALLGFLGFAVGIGLNTPIQAVSTILPPQEVSIGCSMTGFAGGMGSALFICASATLFQNRLTDEISKYAPGSNTTAIAHSGLSDLRHLIGHDKLEDVLTGYDHAVVQTLYLPLALTLATLIGSAAMDWPSVKKKQT